MRPSASFLFLRNNPCGSEAVERMSERADTAYSPRAREEEPSAAASRSAASCSSPRMRQSMGEI